MLAYVLEFIFVGFLFLAFGIFGLMIWHIIND